MGSQFECSFDITAELWRLSPFMICANRTAKANPFSYLSVVATMDFRPRETLFFCDNFLTLGLIGFNFSHELFQLQRQFLSIWFVNKKLKFRGPVIDS